MMPYRTNTATPGTVFEGIPVPGIYLGGRAELTELSGTGIAVVPNLPRCLGTGIWFETNHNGKLGRVLRPYRTNTRTTGIAGRGNTGIRGTGIEVMPNLQFFGYRFRVRTELCQSVR